MKTKLTALAAAAGIAAATVLGAAPALAGTAYDVPGPGEQLTPETIDAYLGDVMDATGQPGMAVAVTRGDDIVHTAGYGHDSTGAPVTAETPMRIASVTKSFTAMAVMTLVQDGAIDLDGTVAGQLPGFAMDDPRAGEITVRHLLNQTSGFSDTTIDVEGLRDASSLSGYMSLLEAGSLAADPGTDYRYCNVNFEVAARLVEVASGRPFAAYMREAVFDPLGMDHSTLDEAEITPANGLNSVYGVWVSRPELTGFLNFNGAGGIITDAADMGRWLLAHTGDRAPVDRDLLDIMYAPSEVDDYAMGWSPEPLPGGGELMMHSGNLFTYSAIQGFSPETGYGFAVLTNGAALADATYPVLLGLAALSEGRQPEAPGSGRAMTDAALAAGAVVAVGLGATGVARSGRWALKRAGRPAWRTALRMVPVLLPVALFALYPTAIEVLSNGREVTWEQMTYFPLPLTLTLGAAAAAGLATAGSRLVRMARVGSRT
ncbi:serine hydrolase domain-containing protein [Nocardiopsis sediminis]|uniref:Serine hydrolase domain-containing protein n=1 Tax=Nocardiopsis sediminis TaxID=1778267 RepID=A0ABV8FWJ0_9ACTN